MCRCLSANRTHVSRVSNCKNNTPIFDKRTFFLVFFFFLLFKNPFFFLVFSLLFKKMNIHLNLNLNLNRMGNMIYEDPRRIEEEEDIDQGVSRTFSEEEEEDSSSCSLSSMCSSSDLTEDDDASSSSSNGPLEDLSDLMSHLPIKKGLSKFYEGRSQSFTSLANVKSLEDLMKRGFQSRNCGAKRKTCRSTGGILDQSYKRVYSPKATISKKPNKTPSSALSCLARKRH